MTPPIDRVRYYDGEYLRAFDFADEQAYHMEMRRRLNMALHLFGIVEGLDISQDTQPGITQYSIEPGMAIDPYGREILVFAPYALDESVLAANRITTSGITTSGDYELWIRYRKQAATPPSTGYTSCNGSSEFTRWQEGFDVLLKPPQPAGSSPPAAPQPTDPQSDDPATDGLGVQLGVVHVKNDGGVVSIDGYTPPIGPTSGSGAAHRLSRRSDQFRNPEATGRTHPRHVTGPPAQRLHRSESDRGRRFPGGQRDDPTAARPVARDLPEPFRERQGRGRHVPPGRAVHPPDGQ